MSVVTSSLSVDQEKTLLSLFDHAKLHLLYKASIHGYTADAFNGRCNRQGPTVIAAYNNAGFVFGAYTTKDYAWTGEIINDDKAFLYSIKPGRETPLRVASADGQYGFTDYGPNYVALVFLYDNTATVQHNPGTTYIFDAGEMYGYDLQLTEFEVYRVEDLGNLLVKPWRNVQWNHKRRQQLIQTIQTYKPDIHSVSQARVLLLGPVGAGKSSFFNSINSVFRGNMTSQALCGSQGTSLTNQFRTFTIKNGKGGKPLPLILCDTMGLEGNADAGLDMEDIINIYKGHVGDHYQFNPSAPLQADALGYRKHVSLKDQIHCVVYVIDTCVVSLLSASILEKLAAIRKKTNQMGIPQLLLMTKVEEACPLVAEDIKNVYVSHYIKRKAQELSVSLGIPLSCILPVKNYSQELELNLDLDILLLSALEQMLNYADSFFENQVVDEPEREDQDELYASAPHREAPSYNQFGLDQFGLS